MKKYDLEDRLVDFSARIIDVVDALPNSRAGNYLGAQLIRCGISPTLNYEEAQSAESVEDFVHKLKIVVKELKETRTCLKLIRRKELIKPVQKLNAIFLENEELIAIISKSIETAKRNKTERTKSIPHST